MPATGLKFIAKCIQVDAATGQLERSHVQLKPDDPAYGTPAAGSLLTLREVNHRAFENGELYEVSFTPVAMATLAKQESGVRSQESEPPAVNASSAAATTAEANEQAALASSASGAASSAGETVEGSL